MGFKTCRAWALEPLPLGHAVKEVQVVKAEALEVGAVAVANPDLLLRQVQAGQQVIVQFARVLRVKPHRHGDVRVEAFGVKPDAPAVLAVGQGLAARQHQADDQLVVEGEQIGFAVAAYIAAQL